MSLFFGASATFLYITYFLLNFVNHIDLKRIKIQQNYRVHISHWSVISKSALRGRRINNFIELWCLAGSGGLDIWVSSTNFQKSNIGWPQQPLTERVLKFNMIFPYSTPFFYSSKHQSKAEFKHLGDNELLSSDSPGLITSATSMTSMASTASVASMTSTVSFHQKIYSTWWLDHP